MTRKKIVLIGTGGTIAGKASSAADLIGYTSGVLSLQDIIASVPDIKSYGPFEYIQFSNMESSDIMPDTWLSLAQLVESVVEKDDVAGVIITHGTDSMEETAYFLHLTVHTRKPIVITGAMRPAGSISADGPLNLLYAAQLVRTEDSAAKGVLVALNGYIDNARDVTKMNTTNVDTFGNSVFGHMGIIQNGKAYFYYTSTKKHTYESQFFARQIHALPNVAIAYCYAGIDPQLLQAILSTRPEGLILVGLGHGTIPEQIYRITKGLSIPVVRASRTHGGMVSSLGTDRFGNYLVCGTLNPMKARILLMLALTKTTDRERIGTWFEEY